MSAPIEFTIPGVPVPKGRARLTTRGRHAHAYTPQKTRDAEATLAARAMAFRPSSPLCGALALEVTFWLPIPASWSKKRKAAPKLHTTKPDLDNLLKLLKDALTGPFWLDDKQIISVNAAKGYSDTPRTSIRITPVEREP